MKKLLVMTVVASAAVAAFSANQNKIYTDGAEPANIDLTGLKWVEVESDGVFDENQDYKLYLDDAEPAGLDGRFQ